jgi:hypothetical protein
VGGGIGGEEDCEAGVAAGEVSLVPEWEGDAVAEVEMGCLTSRAGMCDGGKGGGSVAVASALGLGLGLAARGAWNVVIMVYERSPVLTSI